MRTNVKFLVKLFSKSLQGVGQRPTTLTLVGGSQRETRETAKRFSRTAAQLPSQSRLPARVLAASGRRPEPTDAAAETGCWATSHWDVTALFQKAPPLRPFAPKLAYFSGFMCTSSWG